MTGRKSNVLFTTGRNRLVAPLVICLVTGSVHGAEGPYAQLRERAIRQLASFKASTAKAADAGVDVTREHVTITTAELFLEYADWDHRHPDKLAAAIGTWWRVRKQADGIARALPARELREILEMLADAEKELAAVVARPTSRRAIPPADMSALALKGGYYHFKGRPTFPSSFVWMPENTELHDAYGQIGGTYISPPSLKSDGAGVKIRYRPRGDGEASGYVFFGHTRMPEWVLRKHPGIGVGSRHFTGYDIDHPATRKVWQALLAGAVPRFAGRKVSQSGYLLANEPHWFSATDQWDTGPVSTHTKAKFRTWLRAKHKTIDVLNGLWKTKFGSFDDVSIKVPIDADLRGAAMWYDWCRFNMVRVTDWFSFLKVEIRKHDRDAKVHIKLIPGHFAGGLRSHGLDFETLVRLQEIIGCDAKIINSPKWVKKDDWSDRYACDWRNLAMPYDFFRSISPGKLLFDSEFHGLSTVHWRDPDMSSQYVRCIYWLAHLHGMGMNQTWYWSRNSDGSPKKQSLSGFHASNLTMPRVLDAVGRTMKELNAFAPELVALAAQPKRIRLFYSETAAIQDATYMDHVHDSYRALYHRGVPLGFVTARMLAEAKASELKSWPVIVVTHANHVTAAERRALLRYTSNSGTLVVAGSQSLKRDEYGRPYATGPQIATDKIHRTRDANGATISALVGRALQRAGVSRSTSLRESNAHGRPGCVWRTAPWKGGRLLLVINLGKGDARIDTMSRSPCMDTITNARHPLRFKMKPLEVKLLHIQTATP